MGPECHILASKIEAPALLDEATWAAVAPIYGTVEAKKFKFLNFKTSVFRLSLREELLKKIQE